MDSVIDFLLAMTGSRKIEILAVCLGLANITLLIRRSIWNYPFGIVMVSLYAWIFYEAKLYSDALLQIFFFVVQFYGWYYWLKGRGDDGRVVVRRIERTPAIGYGIAAIIGIGALGTVMGRFTDGFFSLLGCLNRHPQRHCANSVGAPPARKLAGLDYSGCTGDRSLLVKSALIPLRRFM